MGSFHDLHVANPAERHEDGFGKDLRQVLGGCREIAFGRALAGRTYCERVEEPPECLEKITCPRPQVRIVVLGKGGRRVGTVVVEQQLNTSVALRAPLPFPPVPPAEAPRYGNPRRSADTGANLREKPRETGEGAEFRESILVAFTQLIVALLVFLGQVGVPVESIVPPKDVSNCSLAGADDVVNLIDFATEEWW
ncbi:hypothetical protein EKO27_g437 [Xylaria grammica]|uniref:Uncharacterized protein n=1 Tax=Xylaria grammica TaxID=363999 RepID=A0A439DJN9_9PEZI|nr:hypothetical protein EKO27_g437 [Xylaria grammica]